MGSGTERRGTWELINPATEDVIQAVPFGDASDAQAAIDAASAAFPAWADKTPYERGDVLFRAADWILEHADDLARISTEEAGKPLSESLAEWRSATNYLKWFAEEGKRAYGRIIPARSSSRRIQVIQQPMGVIATITAWNFPFIIWCERGQQHSRQAVRWWVVRASTRPRSGFLLAQGTP